eukprot:Anaeramoba_ignava/a486147_13.p1 GENE.a486147_13~~a486147_13.p1  ORF type:complete len:120 (+),score=19.30 a486147_13:56-361(+)
MKSINNLIWISSNPIILGWDGNYPKRRPINIQEVISKYDELLLKDLDIKINLSVWNDADVKKYTCDNIHFTGEGFKLIEKMLKIKIKEIEGKNEFEENYKK